MEKNEIQALANISLVKLECDILNARHQIESEQRELFNHASAIDNNWVQITIKQQSIIDKMVALENQTEQMRKDLNDYWRFMDNYSAESKAQNKGVQDGE